MNTAPRPWNVTLVTILGLLLSLSGVLTSIALIALGAGNSQQNYSRGTLIAIGIVGLCIAVFMFFLWLRFFKGSRISRTLLAILVVLHMLGSIFGIHAPSAVIRWSAVGGVIIFEIIVLLLMYVGQRTAAYFAK